MNGPRVPNAAPAAMEEATIPELVSSLRSSFRKADFEGVQKILVERERVLVERVDSVAAAAGRDFSEALTRKEAENVELEAKCEALREEMAGLRSRSAHLEERAKKAEDGLRVLSAEQEKREREARDAADGEAEKYKNLCRKLEEQVLRVEEERKALSLRERMALGSVEETKKRERDNRDKIMELQVENKNLECARKRAEAEAMDWKKKYGELEAISLRLFQENLNLKAKVEEVSQKIGCENGNNLPNKATTDDIREDVKNSQFPKLEVDSSDREVGDAVRSGVKPVSMSVIEIFDSEDEMDVKDCDRLEQNVARTVCTEGDKGTEKFSNNLCLDLRNDGAVLADRMGSRENVVSTSTPRRKRTSRVIMSDSESAEDESKSSKEEAKRKKIKETESLSSPRNCSPANSSGDDGLEELTTPSRRRLVPLSQRREVKDKTEQVSPRDSATPTLRSSCRNNVVARSNGNVFRKLQCPGNEFVQGHEIQGDEESVESDSEGESLGGFIVNELNDSDNESSDDDALEQETSSDSSIDNVFAKIRREKSGVKWEYEADMLASFGKDPVICMKAVCALYRQQTADEQSVKEALLTNNRGFSKFDAKRGSSIADFLTGGNPEGQLTKSVKDLQKHDPEGVEYCHKLATHYSKQLFMIYQSKEDPYFLPR